MSKNFVFIWIPKNAGTSLYHMLGCPLKFNNPNLIEEFWEHQRMVTFGHMNYNELLRRGIVRSSWNSNAFKFAFIRNPYERLISLYLYLKEIGKHEEDAFLSFCRLLTEGLNPVGYYNFKNLSQCNPQIEWIKNIDIDFVGKIEKFNVHSYLLLKKIRRDFDVPKWEPVHKNSTESYHIKDFYCKESLQIVNDFYDADFKHFNYTKSKLSEL